MRALDSGRRLSLVAIVLLMPVFPALAATVDGLKIHSASTAAARPPWCSCTGGPATPRRGTAQVPALAKKYRVITLDLPGHGQSRYPKDGKFSMDLFARAVEAVRAEARADRIVLVGHSMGAPVIRQYARLYPQHVAAWWPWTARST